MSYSTVCQKINKAAKAEGRWVCFICGMPLFENADHHHVKGRDGSLVDDERYIVLAHRKCHNLIHDVPPSDLERYYWWESYQERLNKLLK